MPVDIWYPAGSAHDGEDFDPEKMSSFDFLFGPGKNTQNAVMNAKARSGTFPLVVFSHGYGGERRQSTFFYTHLASLKEKEGRRVCLEMLLSCLETVWFRKEKEGCVIFMSEKLRFLPMNPAKFSFTENHQSGTKNIAS
jgi:hypothetical protein